MITILTQRYIITTWCIAVTVSRDQEGPANIVGLCGMAAKVSKFHGVLPLHI